MVFLLIRRVRSVIHLEDQKVRRISHIERREDIMQGIRSKQTPPPKSSIITSFRIKNEVNKQSVDSLGL